MARILLRLLILAMVLGVFLLVRDSLKEGPTEPPRADTPGITTEEEITLDPSPAMVLERKTVEVAPNPELQRGAPVEDGLDVQVVDIKSAEPIPNAFVLIMDMERMEEDAKVTPDIQKLGMEVLIQRYGIPYSTDQEGRTTIPRGDEKRLFLAAKAEGAFGMKNAIADAEELVIIPIGPTSVLHAHVVDSKGDPAADVSVFLVLESSQRSRPFLQAKTNSQGLAELRIPAAYLREITEDVQVMVEPETYSPLETSVKVNLHQLPSEPVELKLPACGKVRIFVTGTNGKPHEEMCSVRFALIDHSAHEGPADSLPYDAPSTRRQFVGGETVFDNVGLKTELWVQVGNRDNTATATTMPFGPVSEGEVVDVRLTLAPVRPVIVGQILDLEGKSVGRAKMKIAVEESRRGGNSSSSTTYKCEEGRFRHTLQRPSPSLDSRRVLVIRYEGDEQGEKGQVRFDLNETYPNGETDLGQLRFMPLPLVVSGQVLDGDGNAVAKASLTLEKQFVDDADNPMDYWMTGGVPDGSTDDEGYFKILKYVDSGDYRIVAKKLGYTEAKVSFNLGQENLQVILGGAQDITGRILVDEGISLMAMSLGISQKSEQQQVITMGNPRGANPGGVIADDGTFTFPDHASGAYEIKLTCRRTNESLIEPLTVYVDASAPVEPVVIDLGGRLSQMLIHVEDEKGSPIPGYYLCVPEIAIGRISSGEASQIILTRNAGMTLQVSALGKRTASLPIVHGEETVVLREGYPIEVQVANLAVLPEGYSLAGQLMMAGPNRAAIGSMWLGDSFVFTDGIASIPCPDFGDIYVQFLVFETPAADSRNQEMAHYSGRRIRSKTYHTSRLQVQDVEGLQSFTISMDEEELAVTMESLRKQKMR